MFSDEASALPERERNGVAGRDVTLDRCAAAFEAPLCERLSKAGANSNAAMRLFDIEVRHGGELFSTEVIGERADESVAERNDLTAINCNLNGADPANGLLDAAAPQLRSVLDERNKLANAAQMLDVVGEQRLDLIKAWVTSLGQHDGDIVIGHGSVLNNDFTSPSTVVNASGSMSVKST